MQFSKNNEAMLHVSEAHPKKTDSGSNDPTAASPPADSDVPIAADTPSSTTRGLYSPNTIRQLNLEDEVLEEAKNEQELYEQIFKITENVIVPEKEEETREDLKDKMIRFKIIKEKLHEQAKETVKILEEKIESLKHEILLSSEVEEKQRKEIEDISKETEKTRKNLNVRLQENAKLHKEKDEVVKEMNTLRETNGTLSKTNYDLKTKMKAKDDLIKAIKESNGAQDSDESEENEITVVQEDITHKCQNCNKTYKTNNDVKRHIEEKHTNKCNACDKIFKTGRDLENHIEAKHEEKTCTYCDTLCTGEQELANHMKECIDLGVANKTCTKCQQIFTNQGLKRHIKSCTGPKKKYYCSECGEQCNSPNDVKKHQSEEHDWETAKSKEVCKHWRKGNCWKGPTCKFSHVGYQNKTSDTTSKTTTRRVPACGNGISCEWLRKGACSFFHPRVGVQKPWANQDGRLKAKNQGTSQPIRNQTKFRGQSDRLPCRFDGRCEKVPNCPFLHSLQDFPLLQGKRNPGIQRDPNQRRNQK